MAQTHPTNFVDLTGKRFQSWTVIGYSHTKDDRAYWSCRCDCGNRRVIRGDKLQRITAPYCRECKPRNTLLQMTDIPAYIAERVRNREPGLYKNTFIIDGSTVYGYTSDKECFLFDATDLPVASRHTWLRKRIRGGWYVYTTVKCKQTYFHNVIFALSDSTMQVDHINNDKLDNRRSNLRICSPQQNCFNSNPSKSNTVGFKGVYSHKTGKWHPQITFCRCVISLGLYTRKEEAAAVYDAAAELLFGEYCWLNRKHIDGVCVLSSQGRRRVAEKCLAKLTGWEWPKDPELLQAAIERLYEVLYRTEVAA